MILTILTFKSKYKTLKNKEKNYLHSKINLVVQMFKRVLNYKGLIFILYI